MNSERLSFSKILIPGCGRLEAHYEPRELQSACQDAIRETDRSSLPRISVIVPSLNQGRFIEHSLRSIIEQNYPNLELIVIDGESRDETLTVLEEYSTHIDWMVSEPDRGQAHAINKGMSRATGEIMGWLNSDDCLMPGALLRIAQEFMGSRDIDVVYGHRVLINETGEDVGRWVLPGHRKFILTYADFIPQETMYWRRELWQKTGSHIDESFRFAMDWELICRFMRAGANFRLIPAFLGQFRMHDLQKTNALITSDGFSEMERIRQRFRQEFSPHIALQNQYYRMQRACFYSFLIRARLTEILWHARLIRIR